MRALVISLMMLISISSWAEKAGFAKVVKLRGKVSQLEPGKHDAEWIREGQLLREDTSILTRKKSFVRIRMLNDSSTVTLGPDSKLVLTKIAKQKGSVVNMINGVLRSKIVGQKDESSEGKSKFVVKTPNAIMGVRGTEFITVVNERNKVASLVTLDGEVAMVKRGPMDSQDSVEKTLKKIDRSKNVTIVGKGKASTAYLHKEDVTAPVKVNPVQLRALRKNENLEQSAKPVASSDEDLEVNDKELYAESSHEQIPRNGAVVDLSSGIFIPQADDSVDVGKIDATTGQYIPAAGVKVDAIKGFVAMEQTKEAKQKAKKLNSLVEYREVSRNFAPGHKIELDHAEEQKSHFFSSFGLGGQTYEIENSAKDTSEFFAVNFHANLGQSFAIDNRFSWHWVAGVNILGLDRGEYDHEDKAADFDDSEDHIAFSLIFGWRYFISSDFALNMDFGLQQEQFPIFRTGVSSSGLESAVFISAATFVRLGLGFEKRFTDRKTMAFNYVTYRSNRDKKFTISGGDSMGVDWKVISKSNSDKFYKISANLKEFQQASMVIHQRQLLFSMGYLF